MKTNLLMAMSVVMSLISSDTLAARQGLSGSVGAVAIYNEIQSNLNTGDDNRLSSLNHEGNRVVTSNLIPLGQVRYQINDHQIFVGQNEDTFVRGVLALEIGYTNQWNSASSLTVAVAPTLVTGEVWANPYLLNNAREKTDIKGNVYRLKFEHHYMSLNLAYYDREVGREMTPNSLLNRDGNGYFSNISFPIPFSADVFIEPILFYQIDSAQGKANAFDKLGVGLSATLFVHPYTFVIDSRLSTSEYDAKHPIFEKIREEDRFHLSLSFEEVNILGFDQVSFVSQLAYEQSQSNIAFYNQQEFTILLGGLYRF